MPISLLATRYHRPARAPDLVARPQLTRLLDEALQHRLILLAAPAGFGKTSLLVEWLSGKKVEAAWLSLDRDDTTPTRFWTYVVAALQTVAPRVGRAAQAALQSARPVPLETVLATLINDLAGLAHPLILVLDDYHLITSSAIHQSLDYLLEHLPEPLRLVIATREDPPLALPRLRARGQLAEIRAAELRFSAGEAAAFLNERLALALSGEEVALLVERTEGWVSGLRLAALSLRQADDRHAFIRDFSASHRFVADYLMDEVLSRLDPQLQRFLRRTAVLQRLCAPLCDAVCEADDSRQLLSQLAQANLFLVPLDHTGHWYRYHHLFAEFLHLHLLAIEPELVPALHERACAWCRAHGLRREALGYALAARDYPQAADLIEALADAVLNDEGPEAILGWIGALPTQLVRERPALCLAAAWALQLAGHTSDAEVQLAAAEAANNQGDPALRLKVRGQVAAHRAYLLFFRGAFPQAMAAAREALALLPADELAARTRAAVALSSVLRFAGELTAAEEALAPLASVARTVGTAHTATLYYCSLGEIRQEQGRLHQALAAFREALVVAEQHTGQTDNPFTGFAHIAIGHLQREWGEPEAAEAAIARGLALCRRWQQADALAIGLLELAELLRERGSFDRAQQALAEARQLATAMPSPLGCAEVDLFQARLDLAQGNLVATERWMLEYTLSARDTPSAEQVNTYLTLAQLLVARGEHDAALGLLATLERQLRATGRHDRLLHVLVWQARALAEQGRHTEARAALGQALALGEPEGYVQSFVAGGPPVAALLRRMHAEGGKRQPYLARLLAACAGGDAMPSPPGLQPASLSPDPFTEPLSERELAVLRLMAAGLPNRAIGEQLALSVNTVRWYASQIFAKLGVSGRGAAVARARELGLV